MEDRTVKKTIAIIIVLAILGVAVYGSYLPMRKAEIYISTLQALQAAPPTSLQDLESRLAVPLNYPSPIGQEEIVRNTASSILSFLQQGIAATSTAELIGFLNGYYDPILHTGRGMSFGQDLYIEGAINEIAFVHTGDPAYLAAAQKWYQAGLVEGPNRPQPLYGLFDVYRAEGDVTDTVEIADKILANWPSDKTIGPAMAQFLASEKVSPAKK